MRNTLPAKEALPLEPQTSSWRIRPGHTLRFIPIILCALFYILSTLGSTIPLYRNLKYALPSSAWVSRAISRLGSHFPLPVDLHLDQDHYISQQTTNFFVFILLIACMFAAYGLCMYVVYRGYTQRRNVYILLFIVAVTAIAGYIYVFTPGTLSEDVYEYANYGRTLFFHHANPYFAPPSAFQQDPSFQFVHWKDTVPIYGPIWTLVSALLAAVAGTSQFSYFLNFRTFAYLVHLLNTGLVIAILRARGESPRRVALGTLFYAWNPLVLFESCLGGHNDIFMVTFLLLGLLFSTHAERRGTKPFPSYIFSCIAFTLATLVKLTIAPKLFRFDLRKISG